MKRLILTLLPVLLLALVAPVLADNDRCLMCHRAMAETPVQVHQNCMLCHRDGAAEHLASIRVPPEPVSDETCAMCHRPNEDFKAISAHTMGMECANCHMIHDK